MTATTPRPTRPPASLRYSRGAIVLHWLIALAIAGEIALGWRMDGPPGATTFAVYQLHKSIGITILALTLIRIGWRITHRPPPPETGHAWEHRLAQATHLGFYLLLLAIPLTGWLLVSASRTGVATVLYGLIPFPHIPGIAGLDAPTKAAVDAFATTAHQLLGWALYGLLALHILGALKHHLIDRDHGFARMLPGRATVARLDLRLVAVALAIVAVAVAGTTYPWRSAARPVVAEAMTPDATDLTLPPPDTAPTLPAAQTQPPTPLPTDPASSVTSETTPTAAPSRWRVQAAQSRLSFSTTQGGSPIRGRFKDWSADILFSPDALEASRVRVTVAMASFATEDSESQGVLGGDAWFATAANPTAVFTASQFQSMGGDRYAARGTLRLKGVSRPATLRFTLKIVGDTARMTGTTTLDRTRFTVGTGEWSGTNDIPATVSVATTVVATRIP